MAGGTPFNGRNSRRPKLLTTQQRLLVASCNVRTLLDLDIDHHHRHTAIVSRELAKYDIDVAVLQETRFEKTGKLREREYTFSWTGKPADASREAGVDLPS